MSSVPGVFVEPKADTFTKYGLRELTGHTKKVLTIAWNKDGRRLASGATDKTIRIWTVEPSSSVAKPEKSDYEFKSDKGSAMDIVTCIDWKPDHPDILASTSASKQDTYVRFHDARTNKPTNALALNCDKNLLVSWSPDGNSLVVTCSTNDVIFIDYRKMRKFKHWAFQSGNVNEVKWGPTPQHITMAVDDGTVRIASLSRPDASLWRLQSHLGATLAISYSFNYKYLASGGQDGAVSLWDTDDMACLTTGIRPEQPVRCISFSHDARWLAYTSEDNKLDVLAVPGGELACTMTLKSYSDTVAWSPTHNVLAFAGDEIPVTRDASSGSVCIWAPPK